MKYILDTNVIAALRVQGRNPAVETWAKAVPIADQFVTATIVAEIERGVVAKERSDPAQGAVLRRWFEDHVLVAFAGRVLAFDLPAARVLARLRVPEHAPFDDALIAAIANLHEMAVVTRNTRHFRPLRTPCLDPWEGSDATVS